MIKFQYIIHKETGTVINYLDWLEKANSDQYVKVCDSKCGTGIYNVKHMIFDDDFEIIYGSEFTTEELMSIYGFVDCKEYNDKILELIRNKRKLRKEYGIDL